MMCKSSPPFQFLNNKIYSYTKKKAIWSILLFKSVSFSSFDYDNVKKQDTKSVLYFVSVFTGDIFFWWNERKYFTHTPGPSLLSKSHRENQISYTSSGYDKRYSTKKVPNLINQIFLSTQIIFHKYGHNNE